MILSALERRPRFVGVAARDSRSRASISSARWSARVKMREALARVLCAVDLYALNRQPKFAGPPEKIVFSTADAASRN